MSTFKPSIYPSPEYRTEPAPDLTMTNSSIFSNPPIITPGQNTPPQGVSQGLSNPTSLSGVFDQTLDNFQPQATQANETASRRFFLEYIQLQETPQLLNHFNRHYTPTQTKDSAIGELIEDVYRIGSVPPAEILAAHAPNILGLNGDVRSSSQIYIPNGWGTKRCKFLLLVREEDITFGKVYMTYICGFTDHYGINPAIAAGRTTIDENMVFYINAIVTLSQVTQVNPSGVNQTFWNVVSATQVIDGQLVGLDPTGTHMSNVHLLRPQDVVAGLSRVSDHDLGVSNWMTLDGRTSTTGGAVSQFNNMANNLPSSYLGRLLTPLMQGVGGLTSNPGIGGLQSTMMQAATRSEYSLSHCSFLRYMSRSTGMPVTTRFTLKDLATLDPTIGSRTTHFPIKKTDYNNINAMSLDSTPWNYAGIETEIASKLLGTLPSATWDHCMQTAAFSFTNRTPQHIPVISWEFAQFLTPITLPGFQKAFENAILYKVLPDITRNNMFTVTVDAFVDTTGDIRLNISYEGSPSKFYNSGSYTCGVNNPVHTNNVNTANNIILGFGQMVDGVMALTNVDQQLHAPTGYNF